MKSNLLSILLASFALYTAHAQTMKKTGLDAADTRALEQTKEVLTDKNVREKAIQGDQKAQAADKYTKQVAGQKTEDVYALASKVFERMVHKYNGNVDKMKEVIERAQRDPSGFAQSEFSAEEIAILKDIAAQLPQPATAPK